MIGNLYTDSSALLPCIALPSPPCGQGRFTRGNTGFCTRATPGVGRCGLVSEGQVDIYFGHLLPVSLMARGFLSLLWFRHNVLRGRITFMSWYLRPNDFVVVTVLRETARSDKTRPQVTPPSVRPSQSALGEFDFLGDEPSPRAPPAGEGQGAPTAAPGSARHSLTPEPIVEMPPEEDEVPAGERAPPGKAPPCKEAAPATTPSFEQLDT